jgi:hypothetical protein
MLTREHSSTNRPGRNAIDGNPGASASVQ